jgi:hypothetical protein
VMVLPLDLHPSHRLQHQYVLLRCSTVWSSTPGGTLTAWVRSPTGRICSAEGKKTRLPRVTQSTGLWYQPTHRITDPWVRSGYEVWGFFGLGEESSTLMRNVWGGGAIPPLSEFFLSPGLPKASANPLSKIT